MNVDLPVVDIKRILYATDLSENARYAMAYAVSLANTYCAQITILHDFPSMRPVRWSQIYLDDAFNEMRKSVG